MSRVKKSLNHKRIRRLVWLVLTVFVLFCYSLQNVAGSTCYSMLMQAYGAVGSPPVILQSGTAGTSTIYANGTCAKASVEPPLFHYVDNNDPDVDSSADKGMHSNFPAQQAGPDSNYDTLAEENTGAILDYVDNNSSDVDSSPDVGIHSNFENEKLIDGIYDNLTESCTRRDGVAQGQDIPATVTFSHSLGYSSGNNRLVVVAAGFENSAGDINIGSATYDGQSMTKIVQATTGGGDYVASVALFYLLDSSLPSSSGSYSVVVTADSDPSRDLWACAVSYIGVKQEAPDDIDSDYYVGSTTMTSNLDCDEDGSMLVQACVTGDAGSFSPSSGTTEVIEDSDIDSASAVFNEKLDQNSGGRDLGCNHGGMNRGAWVGACWAPVGYDLDVEVQFTSVIDFLPTGKLCIYTGNLGDEDLGVDYWNGSGWENLATDLTAYSCNEFTVSLTSVNFTIRFKGGTESSDTTEDQWQIDASLLRVEGAGDKEDAVDNDTFNVDGFDDVGTLSNFDNMKTKDGMANLTEGEIVGGTVWLWQEDTSAYSATLSYETYQFWNSWTTNSTTSGTVTKIGIYVFANPGNSPQVKLGIYDDSGGSPNNLLGETNAATITGAGWLDLDIVGGGVSISASTTYHLAHITDIAPTTQWRYRKTATPVSDYIDGRTWDNLFDPAGTTGKSSSYRYGAYRVGYDEPSDYRLDQEVQWTDVPYLLPNENLSIYGGTMGDEDIEVHVWNGTGWETVFTDLSSGWNNASITDWLTISDFTIRFKGGNETGDPTQHTWQIDVALIHIWYEGGESYKLDLEVQWTSASYTQTNEELCIKTGTFSGSENIQVEVRNETGSSWDWVMNLTASQWNNVSITSYLTSSTLTVRFLGGTEMGDTTQDSWNIDSTFLHVWTIESTCDYVDNNTSDVGSPTDKGTHGNFTAQQYGPDSINDTLVEENTGVGNPDLTVTTANTVVNNYTYTTENASSSATEITVNDVSGFSAGDVILVIQMQNGTGVGTAGVFEFNEIASVVSSNFTLESGLQNDYYTGTFDDATNSSVTQVVKVPIYNDVTIQSGASITCPAWNGYTGGIVVFNASGTITVTGDISVDAKGFRGGAGVTEPGAPEFAWAGESWNGKGGDRTSEDPNFGGGGGGDDDHVGSGSCGASGGGGGYGTAGSDGVDSYEGQPAGHGGLVYGIADIGTRIFLGSGGGGGGSDNDGTIDGGDGGAGGGFIIVTATTSITVTGSISADGEDGQAGADWAGAGGAGSGGAIWLRAGTLTLGTTLVTAVGGIGGLQGQGSDGGDGGAGRIRLDYNSLTGSTVPVAGYTGLPITVPSEAELYELDLEIQWTDLPYMLPNEELCIYGGIMGSENITVDVWNGTAWKNLYTDLSSGWNNKSVSSYLTSSNFTIRFKGGNETADPAQDSWNIDTSLLHVWTSDGTYDYVLKVNNTETDSWQIRLKEYSDSNINRLQNCTIYFHNSSAGTSRQIYIQNGAYINQTGPWYDLGDSETIYITMIVQANSAGTSYVRTYLELLVPNTSTYIQYIITFEIT